MLGRNHVSTAPLSICTHIVLFLTVDHSFSSCLWPPRLAQSHIFRCFFVHPYFFRHVYPREGIRRRDTREAARRGMALVALEERLMIREGRSVEW